MLSHTPDKVTQQYPEEVSQDSVLNPFTDLLGSAPNLLEIIYSIDNLTFDIVNYGTIQHI